MANPSKSIHGGLELQESSSAPNAESSSAPSADAIAITSELCALSGSVQTLKSRLDELQNHLSLIQSSIDDLAVRSIANLESASIENMGLNKERVVEHLCRRMCSRGLAKLLLSMRSEAPKLREHVPAALKLAPNPVKLVFECIRHVEDHVKDHRQDHPALTLILEFFLLMIGDCADGEAEIEASIKREAEAVALSWRYATHGLRCHVTNRILLLFVASFGIPDDFPIEYMMRMIIDGHPSETVQALGKSRFIAPILPDVIEELIGRKMYFEAEDIIKTFRIDEASSKVMYEKVDLTMLIQKVMDGAEQKRKMKRERKRKRRSPPMSFQEHLEMKLHNFVCVWPPFKCPRL